MSTIPGVRRIVFREISAADVKSAHAKSNEAKTGGGARDLRFVHTEVGPVLAVLFPKTRTEQRKRNGVQTGETINYGDLHWMEPASDGSAPQHKTVEIDYEPPTDSRPNMGRIPRTNQIPPINTPPQAGRGRVFALFLEDAQGLVWFHYAYEADLRTPGAWHPQVANAIIGCLDNPQRRQNISVEGYQDLTSNRGYCHL